MDQTIDRPDGRTVGFVDYGTPDGVAVLWCHGGPGSRLEPAHLRVAAADAGLRVVGIDRPGYGLSTPQPGRTIAGWVPDALAIADRLGIDQFVTAELVIFDDLGHFSIEPEIVPAVVQLLARRGA